MFKIEKLPAIFYPETTDIYDMKNMPRLCYCIHALSMHMFKLGLAPQIHDLEGQLKFTAEEITAMQDTDIKQRSLIDKISGLFLKYCIVRTHYFCAIKMTFSSMFDIPL